MRARIAVVCVALLSAWLASPANAQNRPKGTLLTAAELKEFIGNAVLFDWKDARGLIGTTLLLESGGAHMVYLHPFVSKGAGLDGTWHIEGDTICIRWGTAAAGEDDCASYYRNGEDRYETRPAKKALMFGKALSVRR